MLITTTRSGYSIETYCHTRHFYPPEERDHRGFTLAKMKNYFYQNFAWADALNDAVDVVPAQHVDEDGEEVPFHLVAAAHSEDGDLTLAPYKVDNFGRIPREAWYDNLARSKFMVGVIHRVSYIHGAIVCVTICCPRHEQPLTRDSARYRYSTSITFTQVLCGSPTSLKEDVTADLSPSIRCALPRRAVHQPVGRRTRAWQEET
jgi:hypothetical protein